MSHLGAMAALGAAVSWSICAIFFTNASRRIGSYAMNCYRVLFGVGLVYAAWIITRHTFLLADISSANWLLLALSGTAGFFLADICLFQCYVDLGPRLGVLLFNTYPLMGAVLAWTFLGEILPTAAWIGIIITISGVVWVALEKKKTVSGTHNEHFTRGVILALMAALFQSISFAIAKPAMYGSGGVDPLAATLIRLIFGGTLIWIVTIARKQFGAVIKKTSNKKAMSQIGLGAIFGPAIGVCLSMIAIRLIPIGIASTLMALMPITILPITAIAYKERISYRAVLGAIIACIGVAILFNT